MLKYKEILKQRAPKIYAIFKYFILYFINKSESYPEKKVRYGKANLKITFYVIRRTPPGAGFFSNYHHVMGHIIIALEKGYLPIVDMENYETYYNVSNFINGSKNSWEYYFEQPSCFNLEEVYNSKNVILSSGSFPYNIDCELGFVYDKKISNCSG